MKIKTISGKSFLLLSGLALVSATLFRLVPISPELTGNGFANSFTSVIFSDVSATHPNTNAINFLHSQHIVEGYSDGTFRPDNPINRAEFTKIVIEANYPGQTIGGNCFPDVGTQWYAKYVCFSKIHDIISGYPDGYFKPANNINFVEVSKILVNVKGLTITPDPVTWYKPYVEKLAELNVIPGTITHFNQNVTRGEMSEMIYRLMAEITDQPSKTWQELVTENASPIVNAGLPARLKIPAINVDSAIETVGLTTDGAVGIPKNPANAAWYNLGPRPGDIGSAVITGHINWYYGQTGVFVNLSKVKIGDKIIVQDDKGAEISFMVNDIRSYDAAADAVDVFISNDGKAHLNLITCEGDWDRNSQQYTKRLVLFAEKETPTP